MELFTAAFQWPVSASGYEIARFRSEEKPKTLLGAGTWWEPVGDGSSLTPKSRLTGLSLRPIDPKAPLIRRDPLALNDELFATFANLEPAGIVRFANQFGALGSGSQPEDLSLWMKCVAQMKDELRHVHSSALYQITEDVHLTCRLEPSGGKGDVRLVLTPNNLLHAMRLQFAIRAVHGVRVRECRECSTLFPVGGTGKRVVAEFCSTRCRVAHHRKGASA